MPRRITGYESDAIAGLRTEAEEYLNEFFPGMPGISLKPCRDGASIALRATVSDTYPFPKDQVVSGLSQLGIPLVETNPEPTRRLQA